MISELKKFIYELEEALFYNIIDSDVNIKYCLHFKYTENDFNKIYFTDEFIDEFLIPFSVKDNNDKILSSDFDIYLFEYMYILCYKNREIFKKYCIIINMPFNTKIDYDYVMEFKNDKGRKI